NGAVGISFTASGVYGGSTNGNGVYGLVNNAGASGVVGQNQGAGNGVAGVSVNGTGVYARSDTGYSGYFDGGNGVLINGLLNVRSGGIAGDIYTGRVFVGTSVVFTPGHAIYFNPFGGILTNTSLGVAGNLAVTGNADISGTLTKGSGGFIIDHPLDPKNKVLRHSFVESPDMKNIYDGIVVLDEDGQASVELPDYFTALNKDYRYQLTPIGAYAGVYIKREIQENKFVIAGGYKGLKVSWQVTGIRKDAFAQKNPIVVEEIKGAKNNFKKGEYLYPQVF
ncbi:MAG: hypothetical protein L6254_00050, partial [Candidatus Omnitrophica bacterium]|nr:hypothetical protein [Candidatus Omnitrophota bacterium]